MKIRHPMIVKIVGFALACFVRVWARLVNYRYRSLGQKLEPDRLGFRERLPLRLLA